MDGEGVWDVVEVRLGLLLGGEACLLTVQVEGLWVRVRVRVRIDRSVYRRRVGRVRCFSRNWCAY